MRADNKKPVLNRLYPLFYLLPSLFVIALIIITLPLTQPVLAKVPELLKVTDTETVKDQNDNTLPSVSAADYADGVYVGSAQGYGGTVSVQVTVENGIIVSIEILSADGETASFFNRAKVVIDSVLASQTWEVDVVSGATYSSRGILGAIQNALTGQQVENDKPATHTSAATLSSDDFTVPEKYADGTYYGSASGFGGTIEVEVIISAGNISSIRITKASGETSSYLRRAEDVVQRILSTGNPNVDTVSGATYSSNGIINAVKRALNQAVSNGDSIDVPYDNPSEPDIPVIIDPDIRPSENYTDGIYTGIGEGFGGDITVQVTVDDGKIVDIQILNAVDETPTYFARAKSIVSTILSGQTTEVDVISGATFSSEGILGAVKKALSKALSSDNGTEKPEEPENPEQPAEPEKIFLDGNYASSAWCTDSVLFNYLVKVDVSVNGGKITQIKVLKTEDQSEFPEDNDVYFDYAVNGRERGEIQYDGIVKQILDKQSFNKIDVVSRATYSSNTIISDVQDALKDAVADKEETSGSENQNTEQPDMGNGG